MRNNINNHRSSTQNNNTPNYQISGIEPNYNGIQGLNVNLSTISQNKLSNNELENAISNQNTFTNNNNQYKSNSTFLRNENNNNNLENLRDFSQFNINDNFKKTCPITSVDEPKYQNNTLYNNLNDKLLKETITEYRLNIDSVDRDINQYHDPFNYVVSFGPVVNSGVDSTIKRAQLKSDMKKINKNPKANNNINTINDECDDCQEIIVSYENKLKKIFNPYITRGFDNIKFIRLDNVVLPRFNCLNINRDIIFLLLDIIKIVRRRLPSRNPWSRAMVL
jgi:hypothetical protein